MKATINCPHCRKSIGGEATEGGFRLRLGIVLLDPDTGTIHGPCPMCKSDIVVAESSKLSKSLRVSQPIPGIRVKSS